MEEEAEEESSENGLWKDEIRQDPEDDNPINSPPQNVASLGLGHVAFEVSNLLCLGGCSISYKAKQLSPTMLSSMFWWF